MKLQQRFGLCILLALAANASAQDPSSGDDALTRIAIAKAGDRDADVAIRLEAVKTLLKRKAASKAAVDALAACVESSDRDLQIAGLLGLKAAGTEARNAVPSVAKAVRYDPEYTFDGESHRNSEGREIFVLKSFALEKRSYGPALEVLEAVGPSACAALDDLAAASKAATAKNNEDTDILIHQIKTSPPPPPIPQGAAAQLPPRINVHQRCAVYRVQHGEEYQRQVAKVIAAAVRPGDGESSTKAAKLLKAYLSSRHWDSSIARDKDDYREAAAEYDRVLRQCRLEGLKALCGLEGAAADDALADLAFSSLPFVRAEARKALETRKSTPRGDTKGSPDESKSTSPRQSTGGAELRPKAESDRAPARTDAPPRSVAKSRDDLIREVEELRSHIRFCKGEIEKRERELVEVGDLLSKAQQPTPSAGGSRSPASLSTAANYSQTAAKLREIIRDLSSEVGDAERAIVEIERQLREPK